jgi:hypothetical protein
MAKPLSFRASSTLIVGAYAVLAAVLVAGVGRDLGQVIANYAPQVSWLMPDATIERMLALQGAGRPETAALYGLMVSLSWGLIAAMGAGGFAWGVLNKGDTVLGVDKALGYLAAMSALYAIATSLEMVVAASHLQIPRGGFQAVPGLWFATMIISATILARCAAMVAHDAGSLIAIAISAEPARLARLVATAEIERGSTSLEARIARRMARLRD